MDLRRFLTHAVQIASALSEFHKSGTLHLDIRPANLSVHPESGEVALDGGLAAVRGDLGLSDETKIKPESLPYIAPERTGRVDWPIDERADLYSLGVTLYELLSGKLPLDADDAPAWAHAHIARAPVPLSEVVQDVPRIVAEIVMKLLAKSPEERYQTARGLWADLLVCQTELEELRMIDSFPLGTADIPDRLQLPTKLYGRKRERALLLEAFERVVATGTAELVLVSGYSGVGKTSLVKEVQAPIVRERGAFISGKFDQLQRDIPYRTIAQAFGELVRQLLTESPQSLAGWKHRLREALGEEGQVIIDIVPQLSLILGEQPPVAPLAPNEARSRFVRVFHALLGAVARKRHPLVLFVDDLQWADPASLKLIRDIVAVPEKRHLLVIGAYRDNEVSPSHPLVEVLRQIHATGARVSTLSLDPLPRENVLELVMDTFRCDDEQAARLTQLLVQRTGGNPFFVGQFLMELYRQRLVWVDPGSAVWCWDIEAIAAQNLTDNVVDLVLTRLKRLDGETQRVLSLAACLGARFDAEVLSAMYGESTQATHAVITPAIREGLVARRGGTYKFLHDRVQQAAYLLIREGSHAEMHLRIGRLLLVQTPEEALEDRLFEITNQLNIGASLITDPGERRRTAALNLRAGRKAKASGAHGSAVAYFAAGCALIGEDDWGGDDDLLAFGLRLDLAESACVNGEFDRSVGLCTTLLERARTQLDKAAAYRVLMQNHTARSEHDACIGVGLECLALLGIELRRQPADDEVIAEITALRDALRDRAADEILGQPRMTAPPMIAAMGVMAVMYASSFYTDPNLNDLLVCQMVRLSLLHGNAESTGIGYTCLGKALCMRLGAYQDGDRIGRVGYDLTEKMNALVYKPEVANLYGCLISVWTRHIDTGIVCQRASIQAANEVGNLTWGSFSNIQLTLNLLVRGDPMEETYKVAVSALDYATKAKITFAADAVMSMLRFVQAMRGATRHLGTMSGDDFDEQAFEARLEKESFPSVRLVHYVAKTAQHLLACNDEEAVAAAEGAERNIAGGNGMLFSAEYHYYGALARAARFAGAPAEVQAGLRGSLAGHAEQLRVWAESCPDNFAGKHALVSAEIARIEGRHEDAAALYDRAIVAFRESRFIHQEALASELAARFYLDRGYSGLPGLYLREAVAAYSRWGASAKVRQLEQRHALVLNQEQRRATSSGVMTLAAEAIDAQTAVKVSRSLSSDMTPKEMMESLMRLVVEHEGAERCCLLLTGDGLRLAAEAVVDRDGISIRVYERSTAPLATRVPASIVNYVERTRERVLLSDVGASGAFAADEYLVRERPKSVLCMPLMKNPGEVGGLLYLENRLVHGAFILRRLPLLEFLAALSLQNTVLRGELEQEAQKRQRTEVALRRSEKALQDLAESSETTP
ncbi:ATP-binding protein [Sorangium sp. So ce854]|uniref:ATP-binding protein n=1 Tax=Sorangium sp. So ce854 TaxID=3133322 RepID=UPI003F63090B